MVAYINLASYYLFGLPLGYVLGYVTNFGVAVNKTNLFNLLYACVRYICICGEVH